ncbi:MAG: hypothetical protein JXA33_28675 [Anaerolineae bacterium]|nr:hypothetical protein [Anaerolineae bacterium]
MVKNLPENYRRFTLSLVGAAKAVFPEGVFALANNAREDKNTRSPTPSGTPVNLRIES